MRIAVIHPSLNMLGGAEKLCIATIKALQKAGHRVTLVTVDKTDWNAVERRYGIRCRVDEELCLLPSKFETSSMFLRMVVTVFALCAESILFGLKRNHELVLNMSGDTVCLAEDVAYVNAIPLNAASEYPQMLPKRSPWWRFGSEGYGLLLAVQNKLNRKRILLTNSSFNATVVKRYLGHSAIVVYPPVNVATLELQSKPVKKENLVVSVSRFRLGKNLQWIPKTAKRVRNAEFLIIGSLDKASTVALEELCRLTRELHVGDRVRLLFDRPFSELTEILQKAKILLHTQQTEAFGMSVVEAMAAGCVPVVPRDGGPWFDILEEKQGEYGYSYQSTEEAADIIDMLMRDEGLRREVSARAVRRTMVFDSSLFERKIVDLVGKVYRRKFG